jgi:hypothetical protein
MAGLLTQAMVEQVELPQAVAAVALLPTATHLAQAVRAAMASAV